MCSVNIDSPRPLRFVEICLPPNVNQKHLKPFLYKFLFNVVYEAVRSTEPLA